MSNEAPTNDITQDSSIKISETENTLPTENNNPPVKAVEESKFSNASHKTTTKLKQWQHGFVELKINRQLYILVSFILFIGLIFGGAIEKIIIMIVAIPLLVSGITGQMFLEKIITKMPWNKAKAASKEVEEEAKGL